MRNPLARLVHHDPDKPTLRERAASLRASAVRVIRPVKPIEAEPEPDWSDPPEGCLPYPVDAPVSFISIEKYLRLEAERLHNVASTHFARRSEEYADGLTGPDLAGALDRARRRLRLDELARAADPERAISTEFIPGDGNIAFEDVTGKVHHEPVARWIGFMAHRMWLVAKEEESRAFKAKSVSGQEANRPLEDGLRWDLRLDALYDLAFRPEAVFEAAKDHRIGHGAVAPQLVSQILAGWAEWSKTNSASAGRVDEAEWERHAQLRDKLIDAAEALPASRENAPAKALALAWIGYAELWERGMPRDGYGIDGRLCLDIHNAVQGAATDDAIPLVEPASLPDIAAIALPELRSLHDVADLLHGVCHALKCQPRCWTYEGGDKPAGVFVERILGQCVRMVEACESEAEGRKPVTPWEADVRLSVIARAVIDNGDPAQTAAFARDVQAAVA
ncbi:hypothetical protein ACYQR9_03695 [Methylobacterium sp. CM6241]